ncbi:DNA N6-methyl adenine demethylase [Portunus trituberculatus]|uniref:DNA N6-methyl adenine demethylase n=1 Tax=Portunus trituberculatus TaxID=210409 RepID=A0A5B7ESH6_PORTR|nr:DNA N6-methyl adenine demethylase [Portunus trituberculatus]
MSSVPGVSHAHAEAAHSAHAPSRPFPPYNCLVDMELGEGLTGRLLDTHNLLFGDGFSDSLSSRVGVDGNSAYRPWEADHPGDHRAGDHRLHPLAASSAPIQVLTHTPPVAAASTAHIPHYPHAIPTFGDSYPPSHPHPHVAPQHPVPHKLPPFDAFSPERSVGSTTPSPLPAFNTLPSPHARYPLVPAPVQAREIPTIQQQMMDERHIRMFDSESDASVSGTENSGQVSSVSSTAVNNSDNNNTPAGLGAVPSVPCSEGGFRPPPPQQPPPPGDDPPEKPVKKKRKRCGDCVGCQRKDNCGDCAPCRNDKSHQICKMRRCDKLTEKRVSTHSVLRLWPHCYLSSFLKSSQNVFQYSLILNV